MVESWVEIFRAAAVDAKDKIYFAFSFGPFIGFWLAFDAGTKNRRALRSRRRFDAANRD